MDHIDVGAVNGVAVMRQDARRLVMTMEDGGVDLRLTTGSPTTCSHRKGQ